MPTTARANPATVPAPRQASNATVPQRVDSATTATLPQPRGPHRTVPATATYQHRDTVANKPVDGPAPRPCPAKLTVPKPRGANTALSSNRDRSINLDRSAPRRCQQPRGAINRDGANSRHVALPTDYPPPCLASDIQTCTTPTGICDFQWSDGCSRANIFIGPQDKDHLGTDSFPRFDRAPKERLPILWALGRSQFHSAWSDHNF